MRSEKEGIRPGFTPQGVVPTGYQTRKTEGIAQAGKNWLKILLADAEKSAQATISDALIKAGYTVTTVTDGNHALNALTTDDFDIAILDTELSGLDGMSILKRIKEIKPNLTVIIIASHADVGQAINAMESGAYDYLGKPAEVEDIISLLERIKESSPVKNDYKNGCNELNSHTQYTGLIGRSLKMIEVYRLIEKVAPTDLPILIQGETGTGKELIARAIHYESERRDKIYIAVNCAALTESLLESELFGYDKGAFTGAYGEKKGYIELATEGILFIDEISSMSLTMQQKLLRVLEEKLVWRIGSQRPRPVNTRFVFASNQSIDELVKDGRLRKDLFYRINAIVIDLPLLCERKEDISLLIDYFLKKNGEKAKTINEETIKILTSYNWPGNVRELENEVKRMIVLTEEKSQIGISDISQRIRDKVINNQMPLKYVKRKRTLDAENQTLQVLRENNANITKSAHQLGLTRRGLQKRIKNWKLEWPQA